MPVDPEKERAARREQALALRMAGATYEQIAQAVPGLSGRSAAYEDVQRALEERAETTGPMHPAVALELARCDQLIATFYSQALRGNVSAARLVHRLGERRTFLILLHGKVNPAADGDPTPAPPDPGEVSTVVSLLDRYGTGRGAAT